MKLVEFLETVSNGNIIIKENVDKVKIPDKHKLTLVNILKEMDAKKRQELIKKQL